jgi:hypothetical protein
MKRRSFLAFLGAAAAAPAVIAKSEPIPTTELVTGSKTAEQILADIRTAVNQFWEDSGYRPITLDPAGRIPMSEPPSWPRGDTPYFQIVDEAPFQVVSDHRRMQAGIDTNWIMHLYDIPAKPRV